MVDSPSKGRSTRALLIALGFVVVVAFAVAIWFSEWAAQKDEAPVVNATTAATPTPEASPSPGPTGVRALSDKAQRDAAARAALGSVGGKVGEKDGQRMTMAPARLVWRDGKAALITANEITDGCHGCTGGLGVYYLRPDGDSFTVIGEWPEAVPGSSYGAPPDRWQVSSKFGDDPVIFAAGGGTFQGYSCSVATLTRLGADKPQAMVSIPMGYSNAGAIMADDKQRIHGKITDIVANRSFAVHYTGTQDFTDRYKLQNGRYVIEGKSRMPQC